jgi:hypothetical protein
VQETNFGQPGSGIEAMRSQKSSRKMTDNNTIESCVRSYRERKKEVALNQIRVVAM